MIRAIDSGRNLLATLGRENDMYLLTYSLAERIYRLSEGKIRSVRDNIIRIPNQNKVKLSGEKSSDLNVKHHSNIKRFGSKVKCDDGFRYMKRFSVLLYV